MLLGCYLATAQQYNAVHTSVVLRDSERRNRRVPVELYYPEKNVSADSCTKADDDERFPVICFAHGYLLSGKSYQHLVDILVPEGFIMACLSSGDGLFPSHRRLGEDLRFVSKEAGKLDTDPDSPLFGRVDTLRCLMGHSMGGGAAFLAAAGNPSVHALVALAPFDTHISAIDAASSTAVPTLIFSGTYDCITPPEEHHLPMYEASASSDRTIILIKKGTHCNMGVSFDKCEVGERMARCEPGISGEEQLAILARYMVPWLRYFLKGEEEQGVRFDAVLRSDTTVTWRQSRPLTSTCPGL
jgi:predicted dienelactone hydrolase